MEQLTLLLNRIPWTLIAVAGIAYVGFDFYQFTQDEVSSPLLQKQNELRAAQDETKKLRDELKRLTEFKAGLEAKRTEIQIKLNELNQSKDALKEEFDVTEFMRLVLNEAKRMGIIIISLKPNASVSKENYSEIPFDFKFRAVYAQVLYLLQRLSSHERVIRIDELNMRPVSGNTSKHVLLEGSLKIKTFIYQATKADQSMNAKKAAGGGT